MGSKKSRRRRKAKSINRVYENDQAVFSIFKSPEMATAVVEIVGTVDCPICPLPITQADADKGLVIGLMGATATWVHIEHFYRRDVQGASQSSRRKTIQQIWSALPLHTLSTKA